MRLRLGALLTVSFFIVFLSAGIGHAADQGRVLSPEVGTPASLFYAPCGVCCPAVAPEGKWVVNFAYAHYAASGVGNGTQTLTKAQVWNKYAAAPVSLGIDFYKFAIAHGITHNFAMLLVVPFTDRSLTVETRAHQVLTLNTGGLGDVQVGGITCLYKSWMNELTFYAGISAPTGSINERGNLPGHPDAKLPYPVQLGAGSTALRPALTYMGCWRCIILWGAQASGIIYLGKNWDHYRYGDSYSLSGWIAHPFMKGLVGSLRLTWQSSGKIVGHDPELNPAQAPATDPNDFGGDRLILFPGLTWHFANGPLKGNALVLVGGIPLYQCLNGPQLKMNYVIVAGFKHVF